MEARRRTLSRIDVVMGVSGSGKSTVGRLLAERRGCDFIDADDLHPAANVARMAAGRPLTDADRAPWLETVASVIDAQIGAGANCVVACSALKRRYRDVLRRPEVRFVYLDVPPDVLHARLVDRHGHFMPASLLDSQLADLEPPQSDERAVTVDADRSAEVVVAEL